MRDIADIYTLDAADARDAFRARARRASRTCCATSSARRSAASRGCSTGLGIRFVGTQTAQILAGDFGTIDAIADADEEELQRSEGIGPEVAGSVALFFKQPANREMIERLQRAGVRYDGAETRRAPRTERSPGRRSC